MLRQFLVSHVFWVAMWFAVPFATQAGSLLLVESKSDKQRAQKEIIGRVQEKCIRLKRLSLEDTDIFRKKAQQSVLGKYLNQCISPTLIKNILAEIARTYMQKGYVTTRPYLREQSIVSGELCVGIQKGILEGVEIMSDTVPPRRVNTAFLFQQGRILNLRNLETSLETMNRVSKETVTFKISPGSRKGMSLVQVNVPDSGFDYDMTAGMTNRLGTAENNMLLTANIGVNNPLQINDRLNFSLNDSRGKQQLQTNNNSYELNYSLPVAQTLWELGAAKTKYKQGIQGISNVFFATGESVSSRIRVSKGVKRNKYHKLRLGFSLNQKDSRNFFNGQLLEVSSYKTTTVQADLSHTFFRHWGKVSTTYVYYQGTDWLGARSDNFNAGRLQAGQAKLQFSKHTLDMKLDYFFADHSYQLLSNAHVQYSNDLLFNDNKQTVGSDYTVRGYLDRNYFGNNAWYINNTIRKIGVFDGRVKWVKNTVIFAGMDYGSVRCEIDNQEGCGQLYGVAAGFSMQAGKIMGRFEWGHPLKKLRPGFPLDDQLRLDLVWSFL